ncbi:regulator of mushroom formation [Schizophyllum commune Tattone D]|nr:regulator of mushroom formation [Schizophyllum commune Tattone D]
MDPTLRIVPATGAKSTNIKDTANTLGLHDTLQYGPRTLATKINTGDGFQQRLENVRRTHYSYTSHSPECVHQWAETQDNLKLNMQRNVYGMHAPMRLLMERKIVTQGMQSLPGMPQSNIHLDILMGRDETIEPADIFLGPERAPPLDMHQEMEKKLKL